MKTRYNAALIALLLSSISNWTAVDLFVPSFPEMLKVFGTTPDILQLSLSLHFVGLFIGALIAGPLSDSFGRRIPIILGTLVFSLSSFACLFTHNIVTILVFRSIQGLGLGLPAVIILAVLADLYKGAEHTKVMSIFNAIVSITLALAPVLGSYLTLYFGWKASFTAIFSLSTASMILLMLYLPETLAKEHRKKFQFSTFCVDYWSILQHKEATIYNIGLGALIAAYIVFVANTPLFFMETLGISLAHFGYYQGTIVLVFALFSFCNDWFISRWGGKNCLLIGGYLSFLGSVALVLSCLFFPHSANLMTLSMTICTAGMVFPTSLLYVQYSDLFPEKKATAASVFLGFRLSSQSLATAIAGWLYNGSFLAPALIILFSAAILAAVSHYAALHRTADY